MKILLTGSCGYIGNNFYELYNGVYDIIKIDKKINKDVCDIVSTDLLGIDHIVHLAAMSGIKPCEDDKEQAIKDNVLSVDVISTVSSMFGIPVTFASSQAAKDGSNTYSLTKMIGEHMLNKHCDNVTILRFSNVYGGKNYLNTKTSVVANFINAYKNIEPLCINGTGEQIRDFIHVFDVCNAIHLSIKRKSKKNQVFDIGTGKGTRIVDLAKMISKYIHFNESDDMIGVEGNVSDISKAKSELGFYANMKIEDYVTNIATIGE